MIVKRVKRPVAANSPNFVVFAHVAHYREELLVFASLFSGCPKLQNLPCLCIHCPGDAYKSLPFALVFVAHPLSPVADLQPSAIHNRIDWFSILCFLALRVIHLPKLPQAAADAAVMRRAW